MPQLACSNSLICGISLKTFWFKCRYREDVPLGEEAYLTTAYFISPDRICNGGRTQTEFNSEGTGKYLFLQNGPSIKDVILAPADLEEANQSVSNK